MKNLITINWKKSLLVKESVKNSISENPERLEFRKILNQSWSKNLKTILS